MAVNKEFILDSNIIIYTGLVNQNILRDWLRSKQYSVSQISLLEVLGYHRLTPKDEQYFKLFFENCQIIPLSSGLIDRAISLRQLKKTSVGDSIIAATALINKLSLVTANTKDFSHIPTLEIINPLTL